MARETGRSRSIQRRANAKARNRNSSVAGASTSSGPSQGLTDLSINLANNQSGGSARGDDFAGGFSGSGNEGAAGAGSNADVRTKEELESSNFGLAGGGGGSGSSAAFRASLVAQFKKAREDRQDRQLALSAGGMSASDNLRAGNIDTVGQDRATDGSQSSGSGDDVDQTKRTGAGTKENPLTDRQILDLEEQGIKEGDFMEGRGFLTPLGTFAQNLTAETENLAANDVTPEDGIIVSDDIVVNDEKEAVDTIDAASKVINDLTYLDEEIKSLQEGLKDELKNINEQAKIDRENLKASQGSETGQTSVGLAAAGGYLGFSGSATGVLLNLAKSHRTELQALESRKQQTIFEAREAARNSQFDLVQLKAQELRNIEQENYDRVQDHLAKTKAVNEKEATKKAKVQTEGDIFTAIQGGATTVADIFSALGGEVDVDTINKFLGNITPETSEGFKFNPGQNASLLGSGMNLGDIRALSSFISENGYTEEVRGMLTPTERMAVDKIFLEQPKATGVKKEDSFSFSNSKRDTLLGSGIDIRDIPLIEESINSFGIERTLSAMDDPAQRLALATAMSATEILSQVEAVPPTIQETTTSIVDSLTPEQLKNLKNRADISGESKALTGKTKDVARLLNTPEMQTVIQNAMDQNMSIEDIVAALTS